MNTFTHITGKSLTLVFNPAGGLSSAKLESINATQQISHVKKDDCAEMLDVFGYKDRWEQNELTVFKKLNETLRPYDLAILNVVRKDIDLYSVLLCSKNDTQLVAKTTKAVIDFDLTERKFVKLVRLFDLDNKICEKLMLRTWEI